MFYSLKNKYFKPVGLLTLIGALVGQVGFAATTGNITVSGSVAQLLSIIVIGVSPYSALDLSSSQADLTVANIQERSNSRTGYTVTVSSANSGQLVNAYSGSTPVGFTAKYGSGSSFSLATPSTITDQATPGVYNVIKAFKISYTGAAPETMLEGTYTDTLTFTIAAK
jgi:hypothetical protein